MEPNEFKYYVKIRDLEMMIDNPVNKTNVEEYNEMKFIFQKSIVTKIPLRKGDELSMKIWPLRNLVTEYQLQTIS